MKTIILTAALCSAFISTAATAQTADEPRATATEKVAISTNEIAFAAIALMNEIYTIAATSNNKENALKAATQIEAKYKQLAELAAPLTASKKPSNSDREAFADNMVKMEKKFAISIANLSKVLASGNKEASSIITPVLDKMARKTTAISAALSLHYPTKTMEKYMLAARKKAATATTPKK